MATENNGILPLSFTEGENHMQCKKCGKENPPASTFCCTCGSPLDVPAPEDAPVTVCPSCKAENSSDSKFCGQCGRPLDVPAPEDAPVTVCPSCKAENSSDSKFCGQCGKPLSAPAEAPASAPAAPVQTNPDKLVGKLICMIGGMIGAGFGFYTVYADKNDWWGYDYEPPLTEHEIGIIFLIIISIIVFIVGCTISSKQE